MCFGCVRRIDRAVLNWAGGGQTGRVGGREQRAAGGAGDCSGGHYEEPPVSPLSCVLCVCLGGGGWCDMLCADGCGCCSSAEPRCKPFKQLQRWR